MTEPDDARKPKKPTDPPDGADAPPPPPPPDSDDPPPPPPPPPGPDPDSPPGPPDKPSDDPNVMPGTVITPPTTEGNGKVHKVLTKDLVSYYEGTVTNVTAVCGFSWAPSLAVNYTSAEEMCDICFPKYTNIS